MTPRLYHSKKSAGHPFPFTSHAGDVADDMTWMDVVDGMERYCEQ